MGVRTDVFIYRGKSDFYDKTMSGEHRIGASESDGLKRNRQYKERVTEFVMVEKDRRIYYREQRTRRSKVFKYLIEKKEDRIAVTTITKY